MSINPFQTQFNIRQSGYVVNNNISTSGASQKAPEKKSNNKKLYWALGTLAALGVTALYYKKKHKIKIPDNVMPATIDKMSTSASSYIIDFLKNMSGSDKNNFFKKFDELKLTNFDIINCLKGGEESILPIKCCAAAKNAKIDNCPSMPSLIAFDNVPKGKSKDAAKILAGMFDINFASTKYTKGYIKEFIETLKEFSVNSSKHFYADNAHTFLHFDNMSEFLADLKQEGNEGFYQKFDKLLNNNQNNKITYITDKDSASLIENSSKYTIEFNDEINKADLSKDIEEYEYNIDLNIMKAVQSINSELSDYIQTRTNNFSFLKALLLDKPFTNKLFIEGNGKNVAEKVVDLISSRTNSVFEKIDCSDQTKLVNTLTKKGETAEELYQRTGKRTFLLFEDVEQSFKDKSSPEYKTIRDFIDNSEERYHVISVFNGKKMEEIPEFSNTLQMKIFTKSEQLLQESYDLMMKNMEQNDFSHINADRFKRGFIDYIALERAGKSEITESITNGILLYGPDDATRITAEAIKNTVDANHVKIAFDPKNSFKVIEDIVDNAEKSEEIFKKTGKRTILEIDNMDELLTEHENNLSNSKLIGRFKGFVEHISKDCHATVLIRTAKSLDDFEAASIGSQRFGLKIKTE